VEDLVALRVTLTTGAKRYFLTWGRLYGPVDPADLIDVVSPHVRRRALGGDVASIELCDSLQEASNEPYFYEGLFDMARDGPMYGPGYQAWAQSKRERLSEGKDLYYLGHY
jgi:hypothetical protein